MSTLKEEREAIVDMIKLELRLTTRGKFYSKNPDGSFVIRGEGIDWLSALLLSHEEKVMERVRMSVGGINFRRQIKGAFEDYAHAHPEVQQFNSDVRRGIEKRLHANIRTLVLSKLTK